MTGKAYVSVFKFYDNTKCAMGFKCRPVLIVGQADANDYVVLPISRVTNAGNRDSYYDVPLVPADVPLMNLKQVSYVRTHKQAVVHIAELTKEIVDFKNAYPDTYLDILAKMEEFQKGIIDRAL